MSFARQKDREPCQVVDRLADKFKREYFYYYDLKGFSSGVVAFESRNHGVGFVDSVRTPYSQRGAGSESRLP